jgi:hypothetical protein
VRQVRGHDEMAPDARGTHGQAAKREKSMTWKEMQDEIITDIAKIVAADNSAPAKS